MGEEEKKPEEEKKEEAPKAEEDGKKSEEPAAEPAPAPAPPPPPQEIVLKIHMHCEGCARKVRRCLKHFEGVEDVITDCCASKVVVKGEKADPLKVLERLQKKCHRHVELISPLPPPPPPAEEPKKPEEPEVPKPEEKKDEPPEITVVLGVCMHCEACSQEIKRRIERMKGVESAEPDLDSSQVTVKGVFDPNKLTVYVQKRTGKVPVIIKVDQEPEKKEDQGEEVKEEKKAEEGEQEAKKEEGEANKEEAEANKDEGEANKDEGEAKENKEGEGGDGGKPDRGGEESAKQVVEVVEDPRVPFRKNDYHYHYSQNYYYNQFYAPPYKYIPGTMMNPYPPQMFSDENPNACSVM